MEKKIAKRTEDRMLPRPRTHSVPLQLKTYTRNWLAHVRGTTNSSSEPKKTGWRKKGWGPRDGKISPETPRSVSGDIERAEERLRAVDRADSGDRGAELPLQQSLVNFLPVT
jgi:hypothetical protein